MYSAKARGKGRVVVFEPSMHEAVMARAQLSADLEHAISAREFVLQYQPIVEIATGRMVGVEALVRWDHPERGRIGPDDFIRVAEESDSILEIGRWVLSQACRQVARWHDARRRRIVHGQRQHLGPAAGPARFRRRGPGDHPARPASSPSEIVLEMTETSMLQDSATTRAKLQDLRDAGIGVSIDDFGTGYSSLSYLQRFPVTTLKIARDFVDVDGVDADAWELANAIVALGRALRLSVIAEGVEQWSQLGRLRTLGCEFAQGFYFARPLDPASIESLLAHGGILSGDPDVGPGAASSVARTRSSRPAEPLAARRRNVLGSGRHRTGLSSHWPASRLPAMVGDTRDSQIGCRQYGLQTRQTRRKAGTQSQGSSGSPLPKTARLPGTAHRRTQKVVSMLQVDRPEGGSAASDARLRPTVAGASTSRRPVASARR